MKVEEDRSEIKVAWIQRRGRVECGMNEREGGERGEHGNILDEPIVTPRRLQSIFQGEKKKVDGRGQGRKAQWRKS